MRSKLLVLFLLFAMYFRAFAQGDGAVEIAAGVGGEIPGSRLFKNDGNVSFSFSYGLTDRWNLVFYYAQHAYTFDRFLGETDSFLSLIKPATKRTVTSFVFVGKHYIERGPARLNPYVSLGLGYSKAVSPSPGFYYLQGQVDTVFLRTNSGQFLSALVSIGIDFQVSFLTLFGELQAPFAADQDLFPVALGGRIGLGVKL